MRSARLKPTADACGAYYHCLSRIRGLQKFLQEAERDQFVVLMREYEAFCEVQVLTYCVMGAYIDLNPVRAGLVKDTKDYPWSGYGAAMAGQRRAKEGVRQIVAGLDQGGESSSAALALYGTLLCGDAAEPWKALGYVAPNRKTGARKMRGLAQGELFTARDLQLNVFGKAGPRTAPRPSAKDE